MEFVYRPNGVCSTEMFFDIDENGNIIREFKVKNGCNGNLKGIASLIKGMSVDGVIEKLSGIKCGFRNTSCPDQISRALAEYKATR